jgi:uncharacterized membrane protein SpoIIM required for sporulation
MILDLNKFITEERPYWDELEANLTRLEGKKRETFGLQELQRFHYLYQRASADLGRLLTFSAEQATKSYLENLVARTYAEIHQHTRERVKLRPGRFIFSLFPRTFRQHINAFYLVLVITLLGSAFGAGALTIDPGSKATLLPFSHLQGGPEERVAKEMTDKGEHMSGQQASFSSSLMTHNIKVALLALGLGLTYGAGTLISLFYNGLILGAVCADYVLAGQSVFLVGWLLPHGSVEIPAFLVAGQAGLVLAGAMIGHGDRTPLVQRLRMILPDLMILIAGVAMMLVWAGLIESFFSQYHEPVLPYWLKISFGVCELVLLIFYLSRSGKGDESTAMANHKSGNAPIIQP